MQDYSSDDWVYTINSCLTSAYLCVRFAVPFIIAAGGGSIVNIASVAGRRGLAYRVGYCSAKAGQIGMTYGLALELGRHNITVNAIAPGAVEGDRIDRVVNEQASVRGIDVARMRAAFVERSPLRRMSTAEDISPRGVSLQRPRPQYLGPVHSGDGGRTSVAADGADGSGPQMDADGADGSGRRWTQMAQMERPQMDADNTDGRWAAGVLPPSVVSRLRREPPRLDRRPRTS